MRHSTMLSFLYIKRLAVLPQVQPSPTIKATNAMHI